MDLSAARIRAALLHKLPPQTYRHIDTSRARPAAVLLPLALAPEPLLYLVLRGAHLHDHAGEVGFPGGKPEEGDADLRATARRETLEEIGVGEAEWLGELSPCPVITGRYVIHPFVAALPEGASPRAASPEVARVLELPIAPVLRGETPIYAVRYEFEGEPILAPHFQLDGCILYGASAYIFYELVLKLALELALAPPPLHVQDEPPWGNRYAR